MIPSNHEFLTAPRRTLRGGAKPQGGFHRIRYRVINGTAYHLESPYELVVQLDWATARQTLVRVWQGDPQTGRPWAEEHHVLGRIGRSTGRLKIPLLVPPGDCGGPGLLDHCLLRLVAVEGGRVLYQHPKFRLPVFQLVAPRPEDVPLGYVAAVAMDGKLHAQFKAETTARAWIRFMRGECFTHPQPEPRQA